MLCTAVTQAQLAEQTLERRIDSLLAQMTLEEKLGQLNQLAGDLSNFKRVAGILPHQYELIRQGKVGSMLMVYGAELTRKAQEMALQSRLKIPLLFGFDVIHGFRTTFPIPLAESCSWDLALIERSARIAATEAAAAGLHWTFAPMVDIARDPRWGRIIEGAGEDPYLASLIAAARVRGFQGETLSAPNTILACAKHFAATVQPKVDATTTPWTSRSAPYAKFTCHHSKPPWMQAWKPLWQVLTRLQVSPPASIPC